MRKLGSFVIFIGQLFVRRESFSTYIKLIVDECIKVGYNSVVIVVIISIFLGAVTTVQTAYNLISPLIPDSSISWVVRDLTLLELAPTIMAIVYAGKVGSNIASELGTMRITEQIDALEVMGINSASYLILPKIIASLIMFPILVVIAAFMAIYAGYITALVTKIISGTDYIIGIQIQFTNFLVIFAMIKAVVNGFIVAAISAFQGYYTVGGALEVGESSTSAVTNSCIAILVADFCLAYLLGPFLSLA